MAMKKLQKVTLVPALTLIVPTMRRHRRNAPAGRSEP
jgi:hypothetical protein